METIHLPKKLTDAATKGLLGEHLTKDPSLVIGGSEPVDVFCADTGDCLFKYRPRVLPKSIWLPAYRALEPAAVWSDTRGIAGGKLSDSEAMEIAVASGGVGFKRASEHCIFVRYSDGSVSKVWRTKKTQGSIAGFFGSTPRQPYCRMTSYAQKDFARFRKAFPFVRGVNAVYREEMQDNYETQVAALAASDCQDFIISDTAFSTLTVNKNFPTACHYDKGDFTAGFGNLSVVRKGKFTGAVTTFPQYDAGVDMQTGDVLMMDVHRLHGNSPLKLEHPKVERLAVVMYLREDILKCGSEEDELRRAKNSPSANI